VVRGRRAAVDADRRRGAALVLGAAGFGVAVAVDPADAGPGFAVAGLDFERAAEAASFAFAPTGAVDCFTGGAGFGFTARGTGASSSRASVRRRSIRTPTRAADRSTAWR
jgi:hypothetical protein